MKTNTKQSHVTGLITLLVFFLFALTLLSVVLSGARIYQNTVASGNQRYEARTAIRYMTTRIRQGDNSGQITVERFGNADALVIYESFGEERYQTRLYCHDGWLMELFCAEDAALSPSDGEKILPLQSLSLTMQDGYVLVEIRLPGDKLLSFPVALGSGKEVPS